MTGLHAGPQTLASVKEELAQFPLYKPIPPGTRVYALDTMGRTLVFLDPGEREVFAKGGFEFTFVTDRYFSNLGRVAEYATFLSDYEPG